MIGIVIPTYWKKDGTTQTLLNRALSSIANQTYQRYKVFLIGDNYEKSDELVEISKIIPSSKLILHNLPYAKERAIYSGNRLWCSGGVNASNFGIEKCISEKIFHICHLDHDDWWEPNHLEEISNSFKEKDYAIVSTKSNHVNGQILPRENSNPFYPKCNDLIHSSVCINFNLLNIRYRNVYEETGHDFPSDCDLWNRISKEMIKRGLIGKLVDKITCNHLEEGFSKK